MWRALALLLLPLCSVGASADEAEPALVPLQQYKPIYFLMGTPDTKVQVSFKGQIVRSVPFYFAYTQLMMWELLSQSGQSGAPMRDVNYNPESFYRFRLGADKARWLDVGAEHESNGKGGTPDERSWNRVSALFHSSHRLGETTELLWSLKAWVPFAQNANNAGFSQYRGLWELQVSLVNFLGPFFESDDLTLRAYGGGVTRSNPLQGAQELTFRAKARFRPFLPLVIVQLFHGFGENMLDYQQNRTALRAGIGF